MLKWQHRKEPVTKKLDQVHLVRSSLAMACPAPIAGFTTSRTSRPARFVVVVSAFHQIGTTGMLPASAPPTGALVSTIQMSWLTNRRCLLGALLSARSKPRGFLRPAGWTSLNWSRNGDVVGSVGVRAEFDRVVLRYRHQRYGEDWKDEEYPIFLDRTAMQLRRGKSLVPLPRPRLFAPSSRRLRRFDFCL